MNVEPTQFRIETFRSPRDNRFKFRIYKVLSDGTEAKCNWLETNRVRSKRVQECDGWWFFTRTGAIYAAKKYVIKKQLMKKNPKDTVKSKTISMKPKGK